MEDIFSTIFDFSADGKTDLSEQFIAYMIMQEMLEEDEASDDDR